MKKLGLELALLNLPSTREKNTLIWGYRRVGFAHFYEREAITHKDKNPKASSVIKPWKYSKPDINIISNVAVEI